MPGTHERAPGRWPGAAVPSVRDGATVGVGRTAGSPEMRGCRHPVDGRRRRANPVGGPTGRYLKWPEQWRIRPGRNRVPVEARPSRPAPGRSRDQPGKAVEADEAGNGNANADAQRSRRTPGSAPARVGPFFRATEAGPCRKVLPLPWRAPGTIGRADHQSGQRSLSAGCGELRRPGRSRQGTRRAMRIRTARMRGMSHDTFSLNRP